MATGKTQFVTKERFRWRAAWSAIALCLVACSGAPGLAQSLAGANLDTAVLCLPTRHRFKYAGFYAAVEKGFYAREGLRIVLQEGGGGPSPAELVTAHRADFGIGDAEIVLERLLGRPVVVLAAILQHSGQALMIRRDSGLSALSDLIGRRIELEPLHDAEFLAMFQQEGIPRSRLTLLKADGSPENLIHRKVDAEEADVTSDPAAMQARGASVTLIQPRSYGVDFYGDSLFTSEREIQQHPGRVAAFRRASLRGWQYALTHPDEMIDVIETRYGVRANGLTRARLRFEAEALRRLIAPERVEIGHSNPGRWRQIADTYVDLGLAKNAGGFDGFLYDEDPAAERAWIGRLAGILVASFGLSGLTLLWNTRLRQLVERRTGELAEKNTALIGSEERNRMLIEQLPAILWATDRALRFTFSQGAGLANLGLRPNQLNGVDLFTYFQTEDPTYPAIDAHRRALEGESVTYRNERQGRAYEVHVEPLRSPDGTITGAIGLARDITAEKQAQEALQRSEELYHLITDNTSDLIVVMDTEAHLTYASPSARRIFGPEMTRTLGFSAFDRIHPDDQETAREALARLRAGETAKITVRCRHEDGSWRWLEAYGTLFSQRGVPYLLGVLRDVTERRQLEEQLLQAQKMEGIGRLAGGVAHDFNNLLTAIVGYADLAEMELPADSEAVGYLQNVQKAAERAANLTSQLLAFARRQIIEPKVLNLNDLITDIEKILRRLLTEDITLVMRLSPALGQTRVDPGQFGQMLVNLVVNARDAMPTGGTLTIETCNVTLDETYTRLHAEVAPGPYILLIVRDTGVGMVEEVKAHLFEPFFTTKEKGKGTGLGLATCYGIVRQSGGCIDVISAPGEGAAFTIYLPRVFAAPDAPDAGEQPELAPRGTETVLLVEDEILVRDIAAQVLRGQGYTVLKADGSREALHIAREHDGPLHLLLTDVVMADMSGRELAERLIAMRLDLKVLFISGYTDDAIVHHGVLAPGLAFLQKPFTPDVLARKVRETLDSAAPLFAASAQEESDRPGNWEI
jgi:PAS domain S-box-containing protein